MPFARIEGVSQSVQAADAWRSAAYLMKGTVAMFNIECLDHVALLVKDLERSVEWYTRVLGLKRHYAEAWDIPVILYAGTTGVALFPATSKEQKPPPDPRRAITMQHFAFRVSRASFEEAQRDFQRREIKYEFQDHDIAHSIYIHDPDGYEVELTTYEVCRVSRAQALDAPEQLIQPDSQSG